MPKDSLHPPKRHFSDGYKMSVFQTWYNAGRVSAAQLLAIVQEDEYTRSRPTAITLSSWIKEFKPIADELDAQVVEKMNEKLITAKVEMLERHANVGLEMQDKALTYLRSLELADIDDPALAVKIWLEGTKLERDSRGIPEMIQKMMKMSDDDLLKEINKLVGKSTLQLEANADGDG